LATQNKLKSIKIFNCISDIIKILFFNYTLKGWLNICEGHPMMHSEPMTEIWELLTEEQKKEVALMKMDMKIQWMETKINDMERMISLKLKAIDSIRKVQEMVKQKK
jgi:hypothetical protein